MTGLRAAAITAALAALSCGYLKSGTWEDDPANWRRACGSEKPPHVEVVHSRYWRAPHVTFEGSYFFEVRDPKGEFRKELFTRNALARRPQSEVADAKQAPGAPSWFLPRPGQTYEVWGYQDSPRGNFRAIVDTETGAIFLSDYQL